MKRSYLAVRGALDRVLALISLVILSPLLLGIAIAVRVNMGRPVLFTQERVGQGGRVFRIMKFRTMVTDAEARGGGYFAPGLDLVTPLGRFLRRTSLDELPQLLNIARGDIAIVGPRPALPDQYRRYTVEQRRRVSVPQGLTGLAQVKYRNDAKWSVRIQADLEYIDRLGPWTDLQIVSSTVLRVMRGSGIRLDQTAADVDDLDCNPTQRKEGE